MRPATYAHDEASCRPKWSLGIYAQVVNAVRCTIVEWLSDEPQPGWVAAEMVDATGQIWTFFDKPPIFTEAIVLRTTPLPVVGWIRCEVRGRRSLAEGRKVVQVFTIDGEAENGERLFEVDEADLQRPGRTAG